MTIDSVNFQGKFVLDVNQPMPNLSARFRRDCCLDYMTQFAVNQSQINNKLQPVIDGITPRDKKLNLVFDIPDKFEPLFEDMLNSVGQKFNKIG